MNQSFNSAIRNPMTEVAISIDGVSKTYPVPLSRARRLFRMSERAPVEALRRVSFDVREGEIFGLIGRNGAGKTTLIKIIATLVQPTEGAVSVRGFDSVHDDGRVRAQIGVAGAEERSFYWRLTVEQNLVFFARLFGLGASAARTRIAELLELLELSDRSEEHTSELQSRSDLVCRLLLEKKNVAPRQHEPALGVRVKLLGHSPPQATLP